MSAKSSTYAEELNSKIKLAQPIHVNRIESVWASVLKFSTVALPISRKQDIYSISVRLKYLLGPAVVRIDCSR
jgi:hypothetical protein